MEKFTWRQVSRRLVPYAVLLVIGLITNFAYGSVRQGSIEHRLLPLVGMGCFVIAGITFLHILSDGVQKNIVRHRLGIGRAAALRFIIRAIGYLTILFTALDRIGVPIGHILLGSAVLGIILGVAAQQALVNFFASIVLIISHPYAVGQRITIVSGALGGKYEGIVDDIGLTHTRLRVDDGSVVELPNATILSGGAITVHKHKRVVEGEQTS
jgi:small-conductance mechanosensitive channel